MAAAVTRRLNSSKGEKPDSLSRSIPTAWQSAFWAWSSGFAHRACVNTQAEEIEAETAERVQKANINLNDFL